jgi:hypothetical protein
MNTAKPIAKSIAVTQAIAVICFVLVPVGVTFFFVPRTTIELSRGANGVNAKVTRYCLLIVPAQIVDLAPLTDVDDTVTQSHTRSATLAERRRGKRRGTWVAGDGAVTLSSETATCHVQSTPAEAPKLTAAIEGFMNNGEPATLQLSASAYWQLTYLLGGVLTGLCALYLVGVCLAILQWCWSIAIPAKTPDGE